MTYYTKFFFWYNTRMKALIIEDDPKEQEFLRRAL